MTITSPMLAELQRLKAQNEKLLLLINERDLQLFKRNEIIAEKVLKWKKYPAWNNDEQSGYAEKPEDMRFIGLGQSLYKLVDEAIDKMALFHG